MRIDSEEDYFKEANYKEGEELASKYMKRATDKASSFIGNRTLKLNLKAAVSVVENFFTRDT